MTDETGPRKKAERRLKDRTLRERDQAWNAINGRASRHDQIYDPDVHPYELVKFFQDRLDQVEDAKLDRPEKGPSRWLSKPVRPPTIAGYAVKAGVRRETLWAWGNKHTEFGDALDKAKAIQEQIVVELTSIGALESRFSTLLMKNWHGWADRVEAEVDNAVTVVFDDQDSEA